VTRIRFTSNQWVGGCFRRNEDRSSRMCCISETVAQSEVTFVRQGMVKESDLYEIQGRWQQRTTWP